MSLKFGLIFSLFLIILVILNVYFFNTLSSVENRHNYFNLPNNKEDLLSNIFREIYEYFKYLPNKYKTKNFKFLSVQRDLLSFFNHSHYSYSVENIWESTDTWFSDESLFPYKNGASGQLIRAMQLVPITTADNADKGTQLKLLLLLENKKKLFFKPKRYKLNDVIHGNVYSGFDRHNSEVLAYYLAMALNFTWVAPAAIRRLHVENILLPVATNGLKKTMLKNGSGSHCIYGKCFYCRINETVCADRNGELEGAVILYLDKKFKLFKYPWRRSYNNKIKMEWEKNDEFCKKVILTISTKRLLNLIDVAVFDFLIQNGDRHHYEMYKDKVVLLDNGKGLGNPDVDELDILAPLYQCCMLRASTWKYLEMISGGSLTEVIKLLTAFQTETLATEEHYKAIERRLLKVYATVQYCIGKYGSAKVLKFVY